MFLIIDKVMKSKISQIWFAIIVPLWICSRHFKTIYDALRDLLPFVQFKKHEKRKWYQILSNHATYHICLQHCLIIFTITCK